MQRKHLLVAGALALGLTASASSAYAITGWRYHGSDYAGVTAVDESYIGVCDKEADNHRVTSYYREYPNPPGTNGSVYDGNGSASPCSGYNSPTWIVDFNVCEATQGCSRWMSEG
ncbi:hypothetical protein ACFS5L_40515 [Streptomyces phyllanthi]|uniref:Secreted protein n=1 Tax=Streptomyces phyllanthi TaxID=1803180 RepID=A0A5N8VVI1_9ACTN|nr:hypothetical protein [Streptomyces phyllanthi]MPY38999.1 hypothetical protein [Streptomyces phyllanthi]